MPPSAGACHTTLAAVRPDCGRALIWSSIITATTCRDATSGATSRPVSGAGTSDGDGAGVTLGSALGDGTTDGAVEGPIVGATEGLSDGDSVADGVGAGDCETSATGGGVALVPARRSPVAAPITTPMPRAMATSRPASARVTCHRRRGARADAGRDRRGCDGAR